MADDDSGQSDFGPVYQSGQEALDAPPTPALSPGETAPEIPEEAQGVGEGDVDQIKINESVQKRKEAQANIDKLQAKTQPMWEKYQGMLQQDQQMRQAQDQQDLAQLQQSQQQQMPQQQKSNFINAFSTILSVAVPIALAFGMRGNGFAKGAMMSALGAAMKGFAQGRHEAAEEHMKEYNAQVKAIHESNTERSKIYHDILSNKRMELEDQFKLIHSVSQEFMDPYMAKGAKSRDMNLVTKQLDTQKKVDSRFVKGANKAAKLVHPRGWADYVQYMKDKENIDPDTDPEGASKKLSYTDWKEKYSTQTERKQTEKDQQEAADPNAPIDSDKAAEMRSKLFD